MWLLLACQAKDGSVALPPREDPRHPCLSLGVCLPGSQDGSVRNGWATALVDEAGRASILYAQVQGAAVTGLSIARSEAPHEALGEPIAIPVPVEPNVGSTEKPQIAAWGDEIAVAFTGMGIARHGDARALWLMRGVDLGEEIDWREPEVIDEVTGPDLVLEHARASFAPDGELWLMWKRQRYGELDVAFWARESEGFVPTRVSEELSTEHDCSPPDFHISQSGRLLLALRSNVSGWLDTFAVTSDLYEVSPALAKVSDDEWRYRADICPEDGPRIAELSDGTLYTAWLSPSEFSWSLQRSWSRDGGQTFTAPVFEEQIHPLGDRWVAMVAAGSSLVTAVEGIDGHTRLLWRTDPEDPPIAEEILGGDGSPLSSVELAGDAHRAVAVGSGADDTLWLLDLQRPSEER